MPTGGFLILPSTKVADLLDIYPQLEDVLIELAPPFKKLKNPFLRKGVARVASLKQAAAVAGLPVTKLINTLRVAVGQPVVPSDDSDERIAYFSEQPDWFNAAKIVQSLNESTTDPNKMPIAEVLQQATLLRSGEILELVTHHLPAPGIDIIRAKGYRVWSFQSAEELVRTFICRP